MMEKEMAKLTGGLLQVFVVNIPEVKPSKFAEAVTSDLYFGCVQFDFQPEHWLS
jgi:hypothetical protein